MPDLIYDNQYITQIISDPALKDYPRTELWRLNTDGWLHSRGPAEFSVDFHLGVLQGFAFILKNKHLPPTASDIEMLHQIAYPIKTDTYKTFRNKNEEVRFPLMLEPDTEERDSREYYTASVSKEGVENLARLAQKEWADYEKEGPWAISRYIKYAIPIFTVTKNLDEFIAKLHESFTAGRDEPKFGQYIIHNCLWENSTISIETRVNIILEDYHDKIKTADNEKQKIEIIIETVRRLHLLHPFFDGNGRTFIFLLKNWLLLQNNLSPMFTDTPNHFTGFSTAELYEECISGMQKFNSLKITELKNAISTGENFSQIKEAIKLKLHPEPIYAAAQINELYLQLQEGRITFDSLLSSSLKPLYKQKEIENIKKQLLDYLSSLYEEQVTNADKFFPQELPESTYTQLTRQEALGSQFEAHKLFALNSLTLEPIFMLDTENKQNYTN